MCALSDPLRLANNSLGQIRTSGLNRARAQECCQRSIAEAQQRSALAQYENAIQSTFRDVSDALIQYQKVREIRAQRESLVTSLQDRKRLAYMRFRGGVDTMLNALNSDQDLFAAELNLAQARRDELLSLVQVYKALGGGWQE